MTDEELEARAAATVELLELLRDEPTRLAALDRQLYERLVKAAGQFARPGPWVKREIARAVRRRRRDQRRAEAEAELARTGIRKKRREAVYQTPAPATPTLVAAAAASPAAAPAAPLATARNCYICKRDYRELHHFYDSLCPACAELNWAKRRQTCDLSGRVALVSGGRVKIGYQAAVMLLRAGARVIVTTRFPRDAVARFLGESDAPEWRDRLAVYGLDLRHTPSVERFASHLLATVDRLDFLLNNACQTVRRPAGFYAHLLAAERRPTGELSAAAQRALGAYRESQEAALEPADAGGLRALAGSGELDALDAPALSQLPLLADDRGRDLVLFPEGELDADLQQVDRRGRNSWRLRLDEVSAVELLEVHLVNAVAPFVLNARLKPLLLRHPSRDKHIVNVSAMEGQFSRHKTDKHPHTNMAKAALNMLTRTSAADYVTDGIHMNSVDTGWVTDEDPAEIAARKTAEHGFHPPLDVVDGAARICDPIFSGFLTGEHMWGLFLKDYKPTDW